jgi:hypothetical protein
MAFLPSCGKCLTLLVTLCPLCTRCSCTRSIGYHVYRVWLTLEAHPLQPGWRSLDFETIEFRTDDTTEEAAMKTLTTFYGYHPLEMVMHPLGLFPAEKKDDPMWCNRVSHVKDVWAMYPDLVGRVTVQCMGAL